MHAIDLLPSDLLPASRRYRSALFISLASLLVAGGLATVHSRLAVDEAEIEARLATLARKQADLERRRAVAAAECVSVAPLAAAVDDLQAIAATSRAGVDAVLQLGAVLPDEAWLDELYLDPNQLRVTGAALSQRSIPAFVDRVGRLDAFATIDLVFGDESAAETFRFAAYR